MPNSLLTEAQRLHRSGELARADSIYQKILEADPNHAEALYFRGLLYCDAHREAESIQFFKRAIVSDPKLLNAYLKLTDSLKSMGLFDDAVENGRRALELAPDDPRAHNSLGVIQKDLGLLDEARSSFQRALKIDPTCAQALGNIAVLDRFEGKLDQALCSIDSAIALSFVTPKFHIDRSFILFDLERYRESFEEFEWRLKLPGFDHVSKYPYPVWKGEDLTGKRILVHAEQGLGDEILYSSSFKALLSIAKECVITCDARLIPIFERSFPKTILIPKAERNGRLAMPKSFEADLQIHAGSLMGIFRNSRETIGATSGYLKAEDGKISEWRERLTVSGKRKSCGISWRSSAQGANVEYALRARASLSIADLDPIFSSLDFDFINLQYGDCDRDLRDAFAKSKVRIKEWSDLNRWNDIDSLAALISALDMVITIPNVTSMIAGALAKECCVLYSYDEASNYPLIGNSYPYYPSWTCYRQEKRGEWRSAVERVAGDLGREIL